MKIIETEHFELLVRLFTVLERKKEIKYTTDAMIDTIRVHFPEYRNVNNLDLLDDCKLIMQRL